MNSIVQIQWLTNEIHPSIQELKIIVIMNSQHLNLNLNGQIKNNKSLKFLKLFRFEFEFRHLLNSKSILHPAKQFLEPCIMFVFMQIFNYSRFLMTLENIPVAYAATTPIVWGVFILYEYATFIWCSLGWFALKIALARAV